MKTYHCDICKKEFGHNVDYVVCEMPTYKLEDFDSGFYHVPKTNSDICNECYNKIAKAQEVAIKEIKDSTPKKNKNK